MKTNTLLMGQIGTGKTKSLETLLHSLRRLYADKAFLGAISMEPGIEDVLGHISCAEGLHWHYIRPLPLTWDESMSFIRRMNTMSVKALADANDPSRMRYTGFFDVFETCKAFSCDRCGEDLGCVDNWGDDSALAMDGLSGLSRLCMQCLVGAKPFVSLPEYKAGQEAVEALMNMCLPLRCSFIMLAHTDREIIHETGQVITTVHTIGQKLAPKLTKMFSEVIITKRSEGPRPSFTWSNNEPGTETKSRRLPWSDKLEPDFGQLFTAQP
jgi:hypothetical protein